MDIIMNEFHGVLQIVFCVCASGLNLSHFGLPQSAYARNSHLATHPL